MAIGHARSYCVNSEGLNIARPSMGNLKKSAMLLIILQHCAVFCMRLEAVLIDVASNCAKTLRASVTVKELWHSLLMQHADSRPIVVVSLIS